MGDRSWLLYGAYGYTGRRIAEEAHRRGLRPVLAGRDAAKTQALATALGCPARVFSLDSAEAIAAHLAGVRAVLHCAGPFSATAVPMIEACLRAKVHYLDITGEIAVIEAAAQRHERAAGAGVTLLSAVGFDVVPSDCLAAMLAQKLPGATHLQLAFTFSGKVSPGTAKTMLEGLPQGGRMRIDGRIVRVPWAWKTIEVPLPEGRCEAVSLPWGDVASAWHSTGIPNVEVYLVAPPAQIRWMRRLRPLLPALRLRWLHGLSRWAIRRWAAGPSEADEAAGASRIWGCVRDVQGNRVEAALQTPAGYRLTVVAALASLERVLAGGAPPGFCTPSKAFGPEFILAIPGTAVQWLAT